MIKIGVIGNGFVGKATRLLECDDINIISYDKNPELCQPLGITINDLSDCEFIFISVPTPMNKDSSCYLGIIESVINDLNSINFSGYLILRSTVPPGTSDKLKCCFMPEFLTEKNYINDFINNEDWVFGNFNQSDIEFPKKIKNLFDIAYKNHKIKHNNVHFVSNSEAEMIKMFKNCFLATKVSFCNEMYTYCSEKGINYNNVINIAGNDKRILHSHTQVPGHDGEYGYGGTCFPKDTNSLLHEMKQTNACPLILNAVVTRNETIDRPNKDWFKNKGRSVL